MIPVDVEAPPMSSEARRALGPTGAGREARTGVPLCVDLDGTLVSTDTLWESVILLLRRKPLLVFLLPFWLLAGRAHLKRRLAERVRLEVSALPYRPEVLAMIEDARQDGRPVVLVTAADADIARRVASYLGIFDDVVGSDGHDNLKAAKKREELVRRYGEGGFEYVGDSAADLEVFPGAKQGYLCAPSPGVRRRAEALATPVTVVIPRPSAIRALIKQLRPHQWAKNALVFVPVLLVEPAIGMPMIPAAIAAFIAFSLCASAGYVLNDLVDLDADRAHRTKRHRPLASGALPVGFGPPLFFALLIAAFGLGAIVLPLAFIAMLAGYFVVSIAYSFYFKSKTLLDVMVLASLYTHRILSGGVATNIPISAWLLAFSVFFFLSLAFAKRYIELLDFTGTGDETVKARDYRKADLEMIAAMGPVSGYLAVLIFSLYLNSAKVTETYTNPQALWLVCPVLLYWVSRIWFRAHRRQLNDDPVRFAMRDRISWLAAIIIAIIVEIAKNAPKLDFIPIIQ